MSPDGRRLTLCSEQEGSGKSEVLDTDNLQPLGSPADVQHCPLARPPTQVIEGGATGALEGNQIVIRSADGSILFTDSLPKRHFFAHMTIARDGRIFAAEIRRLRSATIPALDTYAFAAVDQIAVYSLNEKKRIFAVKLKESSPWPPWTSVVTRYAISPDGSALAVLSNELMTVYSLPH